MYFEAFYPLGVNSTLFQTKFFRDAISHFNLFEEGLPPNAFILEGNITPQGMFCSETTTNSRRLSNRFNKGGNLQLHGYADPDSANLLDEADVAIYVTWVERSPDDTAWNNLVSAFDFYVDGDYEYSLVPANVAVESRLFRFIAKHLGAQIAKIRVTDFLENHATYGHQLNILLPFIVQRLRGPNMPDPLRGRLNRLRDLRNQVAHLGRCETELSKDDCAELITAALFGFRYLGYIDSWAQNGS